MTRSTETIEARRKRLLWRASHRGIREMDVLLGGFARARVTAMGEAELAELETIIAIPDHDILSWATGQAPVPTGQATPLLTELLAFRP